MTNEDFRVSEQPYCSREQVSKSVNCKNCEVLIDEENAKLKLEVFDLKNQLKHKKKQIRKLESELAIYKRKFIECVDKQRDSDDIRRRCEVKEAFKEVFGNVE